MTGNALLARLLLLCVWTLEQTTVVAGDAFRCFSCSAYVLSGRVRPPDNGTKPTDLGWIETHLSTDHNGNEQLAIPCTEFQEDPLRFVVDCPHSSFCVKQHVEYSLANGDRVSAVSRGCAKQLSRAQQYNPKLNKWELVEIMEKDVYKNGCFMKNMEENSATRSEECFCSRALCNDASRLGGYIAPNSPTGLLNTDTMAVILMFNAVKYFNGLR